MTNVPTVSSPEKKIGGPEIQPDPADDERRGERGPCEQLHAGSVDVVELDHLHRPLEVVVGGPANAFGLVGLGVGRLDQLDPPQTVLETGVEIADACALGDVDGFDRPHEPHREQHHRRHRDEGDERELGVEVEQHGGDPQYHHAEASGVLQRVVEEHLQVGGVVVQHAHHLAGLLVVEKRHVEPLHPLEAVRPDGVHHPVGEDVGGDAVDPREQRRREKRPADERDGEPELPRLGRRKPRVGDHGQGERLGVDEDRVDGDPEDQRGKQARDPGDDVRSHAEAEPLDLRATVDAEQPDERTLDPIAIDVEDALVVRSHSPIPTEGSGMYPAIPEPDYSPSSRPITRCWISLVPSPISISFASR